jgi:hypothetical protein
MKMQRRGGGGQRGQFLTGIAKLFHSWRTKMTLIVEQHLK